jgi:tetratricopeptide (TPR) repeat protein
MWLWEKGPFGSWRERHRALAELRRLVSIESDVMVLDDANPLTRAKVSLEAGDHVAARRYLDLARERIPQYVLTSPDTVEILLGLGDFAELDRFALAGSKRFRNQPHYLEGYARSAEHRRDFEEAVRRWAMVRKKFAQSRLGYVSAVGDLRELGRLDEAEGLLRRTMRLLPGDMNAAFEYARVAEARGTWAEAHRRWAAIRHRHPAGFMGAAQALQKLGRTSEAEELLVEGRLRYPTEAGIAITYAHIAEETGNPEEARKRWNLVRQRFPRDRSACVQGLRFLRDQKDWEEADAMAQETIEWFRNQDWPLAEHALVAHSRRDWPEAARRWAALRAAFPNQKDAPQREAEALAAAGKSATSAAG